MLYGQRLADSALMRIGLNIVRHRLGTMSFRFRLGPFTFGRSGVRLSVWKRLFGFSIPLSREGRAFSRIGFGPFSWFFNGSPAPHGGEAELEKRLHALGNHERGAIKAFGCDLQFLEKIQRFGVPWRGVQERLKEELPGTFPNRDEIAYSLVPKAMDIVYGEQESAWKTEKRPSKSGNGYTTWIVIIETGA